MRVLIVTQQFPNSRDPLNSPFNRQLASALARRCEVEVLAPVPWFPLAGLFSRWTHAGRLAAVPRRESFEGLTLVHPRYLHLPRVGRALAGWLYAASLAPAVLRRRGRFDALFSSWAYPDGFASVLLARLLGVPVVVKVSGSDINVNARDPWVRPRLRWALPRAQRIVAVSRALAEAVVALGVAPERVAVVTNGVDAELFSPRDRGAARAALGHAGDTRPWLLYVGRLEEAKGVGDLLDAFAVLARGRDDVRLAVVGEGSQRARCEQAAAALGDRLIVAGGRPLAEVPTWMAACHALVLPSWAEGTPNVVLEALTCGRPVVATAVGGIPDVVTAPELGELVPPRDPARLAEALGRAADRRYDPLEIARAGGRGGWDESARKVEATLREALA